MHHVKPAAEIVPVPPPAYAGRSTRFARAAIVGRHVGAVHTGLDLCTLADGGSVDVHLHAFEESFYVLEGHPVLTVDGVSHRLAPDECGLVPLGVEHAWSADGPARWLEAHAPAPRTSGPPDTFFTGAPAPAPDGAGTLDIRDPRSRLYFRLGPGQMDVDNLKIGAPMDAPTVSAGMNTALLAYSGIAVKMLVDQRLGAALHTMFMVEYQPGGLVGDHDHPLEEAYYIVEGEVDAVAEDERFTLRAGDVFWTGVGCRHAFYNVAPGKVRWIETQSPQPPANHSYRHDRDWDHLASILGAGSGAADHAPGDEGA